MFKNESVCSLCLLGFLAHYVCDYVLMQMELEDIAPLRKLRIGHDGRGSRPDWYLEKVHAHEFHVYARIAFNSQQLLLVSVTTKISFSLILCRSHQFISNLHINEITYLVGISHGISQQCLGIEINFALKFDAQP